jgi:hypothetical protein
VAFCLFLTACALVKLAARVTPHPGLPAVDRTDAPVPVILYGLASFNEAPDAWSLSPFTAPALLSLIAGAVLTVLTTNRDSGRSVVNAVLVVGRRSSSPGS